MNRDATKPDHEALDGEFVYRRRSKPLTISRRHPRARLRRAIRVTAWLVFVVLPAGFLLVLLGRYLTHGPSFALAGADAIVVTGNHYVTSAEVANALGAGAEPNVFHLSLNDARRQVEAIPWVRSALLRRVAPNRLLVEITERTPVAYVSLAGGLKLVDAYGVLLEKPAEAKFDFPVIAGIDAQMTPADRAARLALFDRFAQELNSPARGAGWLVSEVDLSDDADLKALLVQGRESILVHFGNRDFGERFHTFVSLLPEVERTAPAVDSVDLRYRGQVVVDPKEQAPAAARGKAAAR